MGSLYAVKRPRNLDPGASELGPVRRSASAVAGGSTGVVPSPFGGAPRLAPPLLPGGTQGQGQTGPPKPPTPLVNTSTTNPTIDGTVIPTLLERAKGGMGADTAIRLASGASRDALSGILKETEGNAARRGIGGSGAEGLMKGNAIARTQREIAGQSADIAYGAEQDRNNLYKDIAGIAGNSDAMQNEQRRIGLSQWQAQQSQANEQQRMAMSRDDQLLNVLRVMF